MDKFLFRKNNKGADANSRVSMLPGDSLSLNAPRDVSVQVLSENLVLLYVADTGNNCVRVMTFEKESLDVSHSVTFPSFNLLKDHQRRLFKLESRNPQTYYQVLPRTRLVCLATWGGFGVTPGLFNSPRAISSCLSTTAHHVEAEADRIASGNKHKVFICVAVADSNRVQLFQHSVHINTSQDLSFDRNGCCVVQ